MGFTIAKNQKVVCTGDSITAIGWYWPFQRSVFEFFTRRAMVNGKPREQDLGRALWENSGASGAKVADMDANVGGRILAFNPAKVIIEIGINDCGATSTADATFQTSYASVLDKTLAGGIPAASIMCLTPMSLGENWPTGANLYDTDIDSKAAIVRSLCSARGIWVADIRAAFFTWQAANNPGHLTSGLITYDGGHPTYFGREWMSSIALAATTLTAP